jgi:hypothetical protein
MVFELFDPQSEVRIGEGTSLPHWFQPGVTYFVTFRTEDSIPTDVSRLWHPRSTVYCADAVGSGRKRVSITWSEVWSSSKP